MNREIECLIERYYQVQEHRIAMGNQVLQLRKAGEEVNPLEDYYKRFYEIEKDIAKYLGKAMKDHKMWVWLKKVKGIGPILASALLVTIDIRKAQHASSVWKYAGLAPGQRREKGKKLDFNPFLKVICWKIGESFVKTKGEYRNVYDSAKAFYQQKFPFPVQKTDKKGKPMLDKDGKPLLMYTKIHLHNMAKRKAVKLFLSHFWAEWRKEESLPVSEPYAHRGLANAVE
jgi:hypothetical protein